MYGRLGRWTRLATFVARSVTVGLAAAFVVVLLRPDLIGRGPDASAPTASSFSAAVAASAPAVVNIHTTTRVRAARGLFDELLDRDQGGRLPPRGQGNESNLGSGVIVDELGHVLTNRHVIEGADEIRVALMDGRVVEATVVGTDPDTDIALLSVDEPELPVIQLGSSRTISVGDVVLAIGNPYGFGQTVTQGIVSATDRGGLGYSPFEDFIQTDAAINPGNSGGALVDTRGQLIGINTLVYSADGSSIGIGFAIPVDLALGVMEALLRDGRVIRGWLGIEPQDMDVRLAASFGLESPEGVVVAGVYRGGPAHLAGLRAGDLIMRIDGTTVSTRQQALELITDRQPGDRVVLDGIRANREFQVSVLVGERPVQGD